MTPRDAILERARRALADVPASETPTDIVVRRPDRSRVLPAEESLSRFMETVADYRASIDLTDESALPTAVAQVLAGRTPMAGSGPLRILVPPGFPVEILPVGIEQVLDGPDVPVSVLDGCDGVVSTAAVGIAETGTIVLDHGAGQGRRAATLVVDLHVCLVRTDQVVAGVPDAVAMLDPGRPQTWISGPSATSDIELDRVEGVHGPRTLHVLLVAPI